MAVIDRPKVAAMMAGWEAQMCAPGPARCCWEAGRNAPSVAAGRGELEARPRREATLPEEWPRPGLVVAAARSWGRVSPGARGPAVAGGCCWDREEVGARTWRLREETGWWVA